jgi:hypothetical protein
MTADDERSGLAGKARIADPPRLDNYMTNSNKKKSGIVSSIIPIYYSFGK